MFFWGQAVDENSLLHDAMTDKPTLETWYLQEPKNGGNAFWDNYVHDDCLVLMEQAENPFRDKAND